MKRTRVIATLVTAGLAVGVASGCGSSSDSKGDSGGSSNASSNGGKALHFLFVGDTTGPTKGPGVEQLYGLKAGIAYQNAHGGFGGHKAELDQVETNGDPATAVTATIKYLTSHPKPDFVWAGNEGNQIAALIPVMQQKGLLSGAVNDGHVQCQGDAASKCPTFFSIGQPSAVALDSAANYFKDHGIKSVGILEEKLAFTQTETPAMEKALQADGIKTTKVSFSPTAVDLTAQVSQLKSKGVQGIFAEALAAPAGYALGARTKLGWKAPVVFDLAGSSLDLTKLTKPGDLDGVNELVPSPTNGTLDLPGIKELRAANQASGGGLGTQPLYIAALPWDLTIALSHAFKQAGSTDPKAVADAMVNLDAAGASDPLLTVTKKIKYTTDTHVNTGATPEDTSVLPAGPLVDGQLTGKGTGQ